MQPHEIYHPVSTFLVDFHSEWHVRYEQDLVKYAAVVDNQYGVEVLMVDDKRQIMNVFLLNNGRFLEAVAWVGDMAYCNLDEKVARLIDWIELTV